MTALALSDYNNEFFSSPGISSDAKELKNNVISITDDLLKNARVNSKNADLEIVYREASKEDWDGHGAVAADTKSYLLAKTFLSQLPNNMPTPEIAIDPDGEISFEWYISDRKLVVLSIGGNGEINYVGVIGKNRQKGKEHYNQQIPKTILELFKRIFSQIK